jgi:hypothetical protein
MALPLKDILAAISDEINRAGVASDINRSHWQAIYDDHPLLQESSPSRVRISEAKVSIPLAVDDLGEEEQVKPELTTRQLMEILPDDVEPEKRYQQAQLIRAELLDDKRHLLNRNIKNYVQKAALRANPELKPEQLKTQYLDHLKREYLALPQAQRNTRFQFRTSELEKIDPERIIRLELTINVD